MADTPLNEVNMEFSKITLGTVQFGLNYGIANTEGKPSYEKAREIVSAAYENGITSFDTAAAYGDSEKVLGKILQDLKIKDKVKVVSKVSPVKELNLSRKEAESAITRSVEKSLQRLGIEQLAACLFHREEDYEYIDILRKLESKGLTAGSGVSLDSPKYCEKVLENEVKYLQLPYNIFDHRFDAFWQKAEASGITIFTRSVYLQGLLLMPEDKIKQDLKRVIPVRRQLEDIAAECDIDMPELCMRYVLCNTAISSVLTGVDSKEQLLQNVNLFKKGPLPDELLRKIKDTVPDFPENIIRPNKWKK
jgi:aryl-alcohol dehydrogenase-like predicted oxidoreductase